MIFAEADALAIALNRANEVASPRFVGADRRLPAAPPGGLIDPNRTGTVPVISGGTQDFHIPIADNSPVSILPPGSVNPVDFAVRSNAIISLLRWNADTGRYFAATGN